MEVLGNVSAMRDEVGGTADPELDLVVLQSMVRELLTRYLGRGELELPLVMAAYDAGIATGFYGSVSVIAHGLRDKFVSMLSLAMSAGRIDSDRASPFLIWVMHIGRVHGREIVGRYQRRRDLCVVPLE